MNSKFLSLIAGVSALALAGVATAAEPMHLSDAQMDGVTAGTLTKYRNVFIGSVVYVQGAYAQADAEARAQGYTGSFAETDTYSNAVGAGVLYPWSPNSSVAISNSTSGAK